MVESLIKIAGDLARYTKENALSCCVTSYNIDGCYNIERCGKTFPLLQQRQKKRWKISDCLGGKRSFALAASENPDSPPIAGSRDHGGEVQWRIFEGKNSGHEVDADVRCVWLHGKVLPNTGAGCGIPAITRNNAENCIEPYIMTPGQVVPAPGWERRASRTHDGAYYYENKKTGETRWRKPMRECRKSRNGQKDFFIDIETGKIQSSNQNDSDHHIQACVKYLRLKRALSNA